MPDYIPKLATIEQSCEWLRARLGGVWILPRLLECHLKPYFWIDYKPEYPQIFGGKVEGYLTWMIFASDVHRLEVDGTNALVNMFTTHDGTPVKIEPGWIVPLSELRFKREALERVASILEGEVSRQNPAPSGAPESDERKDAGETLTDDSRIFAKRAMVAELRGIWPSITGDLSEASREKGDLKAANVRRSYWNVDMCIKWAVAHKKITNNQQLKNYVIQKDDSPFAALLKTLFKI